jgi:hypothetical protein
MRKELILADGIIFNNDYEGSPAAGVVKIPKRDVEVSARDYNKADGIEPGVGSTEYENFPITKDIAVNEIIDGYDAELVPDNLGDEVKQSGCVGRIAVFNVYEWSVVIVSKINGFLQEHLPIHLMHVIV